MDLNGGLKMIQPKIAMQEMMVENGKNGGRIKDLSNKRRDLTNNKVQSLTIEHLKTIIAKFKSWFFCVFTTRRILRGSMILLFAYQVLIRF